MRKKLLLLSMLLLGVLLLSACTGGAVRGTSWAGLAADENNAYLADGTTVYAVSIKDGSQVWKYPAKANSKQTFYAAPVLTTDGLVIVGSSGNDHILVAINPADIDSETGSPLPAWTFTEADGPWVATPLIVDNRLFAPNTDGNLYVFDLTDGQSQKQPVKVIELAGRLWAQPVTDGTTIFVTSLDHSVYAVDMTSLEMIWHQDVSGAIPGAPALGADGMLYVGSLDSKLEQFDPVTGANQSALTSKQWLWGAPIVDGDTLYFGDLDGNFYSFNTSTSALNWSVQPDGPITASPIPQGDHLLIATESGNVYAINKEDGSIIWPATVGGQLYTTPVVSGDLILVSPLGADFYLAALNSDGRQVWTFAPGK